MAKLSDYVDLEKSSDQITDMLCSEKFLVDIEKSGMK